MEKFRHLLGFDGAITPADFVGVVDRLPRGAVLLEFADHRAPRGVSVLVELFAQVIEVLVIGNVVSSLPRDVVTVAIVGLRGGCELGDVLW